MTLSSRHKASQLDIMNAAHPPRTGLELDHRLTPTVAMLLSYNHQIQIYPFSQGGCV